MPDEVRSEAPRSEATAPTPRRVPRIGWVPVMRTPLRTTAIATGLVALMAASGAYAAARISSPQISACVGHKSGVFYAADQCRRRDARLTWSVAGPPGPAGTQGPARASGGDRRKGRPWCDGRRSEWRHRSTGAGEPAQWHPDDHRHSSVDQPGGQRVRSRPRRRAGRLRYLSSAVSPPVCMWTASRCRAVPASSSSRCSHRPRRHWTCSDSRPGCRPACTTSRLPFARQCASRRSR